jgi:hypothetical protein
MKEGLLICASIISVITLIGYYSKYRISYRKIIVELTTLEIMDEILHFSPAIPESDWNLFISEKFDKIDYNDASEMISALINQKSLPMVIAFFALYYKVKKAVTKLLFQELT